MVKLTRAKLVAFKRTILYLIGYLTIVLDSSRKIQAYAFIHYAFFVGFQDVFPF